MVTVEARPQPLEFDPQRSAVIVVDMQNDFGSPGGMFAVAGIDIGGIAAVAEALPPVLKAARDAGIPVVYLKMEHAPDLSDVGPADAPHRIKHEPMGVGDGRTLIRDTWNTQILDSLTPEPGDHVVSKHRYSGFFETELDDVLRSLGAKYLIVTGCTTSICVESTVRDAMFRDYSCLVLGDCTAEPIGTHESSLKVIETLFGWVTTSDVICAALARDAELV
jgi:ureidoacrylate peracid hydrolase